MDRQLKSSGLAGNLAIHAYDLPDAVLLDASPEAARCMVWRPSRIMVVIGKGSDPELEVNLESAAADDIPVLRRATGGCAVMLSPEMLITSLVIHHDKQLQSKEYFHLFNSLIIDALARQQIAGLKHRGISDIASNGRKIAGTSIYRNRHLVFFHAVINVGGRTDMMEKYLKIPPRTPDYRHGRSHAEFVTSLVEQGFMLDQYKFTRDMQRSFDVAARELIAIPAEDKL